jgi:hypothetical protein
MVYIPAHDSPDGTAKVIYTSKDGKTSKTLDAQDWLAQLITHIPNRGRTDGPILNSPMMTTPCCGIFFPTNKSPFVINWPPESKFLSLAVETLGLDLSQNTVENLMEARKDRLCKTEGAYLDLDNVIKFSLPSC